MFRHVVLLTLHDTTADAEVDSLLAALRTLPDRIPMIRSYSAGRDAGVSPGNATVAAVGDFDDVDGYLAYRDHPAHIEVIEQSILPHLASRTAIQYEL